VFLNDLPNNDFNNVAKRLVAFQQNSSTFGSLVTSIVQGSFYKRLFPSSSLHLAFASNSINWLSEVSIIVCPFFERNDKRFAVTFIRRKKGIYNSERRNKQQCRGINQT
jgi:hypothetical protein